MASVMWGTTWTVLPSDVQVALVVAEIEINFTAV
jgi:hypothetical protein